MVKRKKLLCGEGIVCVDFFDDFFFTIYEKLFLQKCYKTFLTTFSLLQKGFKKVMRHV